LDAAKITKRHRLFNAYSIQMMPNVRLNCSKSSKLPCNRLEQ
jgi:hypothetical protein